jgi:hypothetical protein
MRIPFRWLLRVGSKRSRPSVLATASTGMRTPHRTAEVDAEKVSEAVIAPRPVPVIGAVGIEDNASSKRPPSLALDPQKASLWKVDGQIERMT